MPNVEPPESTRLGEVVWLAPYPDALLTDDVFMSMPPAAPPGLRPLTQGMGRRPLRRPGPLPAATACCRAGTVRPPTGHRVTMAGPWGG